MAGFCRSQQRHPSDGPSRCNVLDAKTQYSSGTSLRCPLDIFAPALPPFPASRYAELVSGGHLPTIAVRGWTAPSLYVFLASLELSFWLATLSSGCIAGSQEVRIIILAGGRPVALVLLGDSWVPQNVVGVPPIHFGREDGIERTLLRVACQSETFLASPWQGDASIRFVGHIGCQSDFDELVSMAFRPVDRGFCRMGETKVPFYPVKSRFGRRKSILMPFRPPKGGFGRTKVLIAEVQAQASRLIELGAALEL